MTTDRYARFREWPCPSVAGHADMPAEYAARSVWMSEMARTHIQSRCGGCGQRVVWTAREGFEMVTGGDVNGIT